MQNFTIINKIGEGAYSTVYTVRRIEDNNLYALKKVKIKNLSLKEKQNALNEVRILASVNSPFVISYKESFIDEKDQTLCIVMEYADEGDLFQKITLYKKLHVTFDENDVWKIFIQITKGLHDLHEFNILHRDLKSANVFLFRDGTAKLGDLNVSKISFRGLGCTQTGTPYYASPEVWKDNPYDLKSDIWSLGCLCYELLMLKTPFRADSMENLYRKVMKGEYPEINKRYSNKFDDIISYMLQLKPENRPNTEQILNLPEIKEKIIQLNIYPLNGDEDKINVEDNKNRINSSKSRMSNNNKSFQSNEQTNSVNNITQKNVNNSMDQSIYEKDNNLIKTPSRINKSEIITIMNNNINYFNQKKKEENKFVLNTIRIPKALINLNKRLPASQYDTDIKSKSNQKVFYGLSFQNKGLPLLKMRNNSIELNNSKRNKEKNIELINSKSVEFINNEKLLNENNRNKIRNNKFNTLKMMIDKNKPFNYKGKIDIIVEE
jgi:NIMA (never in mitosis gene a)-related kinase